MRAVCLLMISLVTGALPAADGPADASSPVPAGGLKVGVIDMARVLAGYYKTAQAERCVGEGKERARRQLAALVEKHHALRARLESADTGAPAEAAAAELVRLEQEMANCRARCERELQEHATRMRRGLLDEIRLAVEKQASADGYDVVLDTGRDLPGQTGALLYARQATDFSDAVLRELNKTAPAPAEAAVTR